MPWPAAQVAHAAQLSTASVFKLASDLNVPVAHGVHVRSDEMVATALV
jgi:hypothetical protein